LPIHPPKVEFERKRELPRLIDTPRWNACKLKSKCPINTVAMKIRATKPHTHASRLDEKGAEGSRALLHVQVVPQYVRRVRRQRHLHTRREQHEIVTRGKILHFCDVVSYPESWKLEAYLPPCGRQRDIVLPI